MRRNWIVASLLLLVGVCVLIYARFSGDAAEEGRKQQSGPAPVEVAPVERGSIQQRRIFSGTLQSPSEFKVAPKVDGRIVSISVDVSDPVRRGQIVAVLDSAEFQQAVAQAEAEVALAEANVTEARNSNVIAQREFERMTALHKQGIASDSQLDTARANHLTKQAAVQVSEAEKKRAEAALAAARIRLGYTKVAATWTDGDNLRVVSERLVNEGDTVAANAPLLTIVELDPIQAVVFVTEKDYGRLQPGQVVELKTDAHAGRAFKGKITRIAPVFRQASRQARVELSAENSKQELKPGMFVRAEVVLDQAQNATIVPEAALTTRDGVTGVFMLNRDGKTVSWRPVKAGIRDADRVQVTSGGLSGRVVTLGQQLIDDGSAVTVSNSQSESRAEAGSK